MNRAWADDSNDVSHLEYKWYSDYSVKEREQRDNFEMCMRQIVKLYLSLTLYLYHYTSFELSAQALLISTQKE